MNTPERIMYSLMALFVLAVCYSTVVHFLRYSNRYRFRKRIKCLFGQHEPGVVRDAVGGRRLQRCDWCDKVVHEYTVTKDQLKGETIRRL